MLARVKAALQPRVTNPEGMAGHGRAWQGMAGHGRWVAAPKNQQNQELLLLVRSPFLPGARSEASEVYAAAQTAIPEHHHREDTTERVTDSERRDSLSLWPGAPEAPRRPPPARRGNCFRWLCSPLNILWSPKCGVCVCVALSSMELIYIGLQRDAHAEKSGNKSRVNKMSSMRAR